MLQTDSLGPLWPSPWPAEDGGPERLAAARGGPPRDGVLAAWRDLPWAVMPVLRDPGELFLYSSSPAEPHCRLERLDPVSLVTEAASPPLDEGGTWWPGGVLAHADGHLYVTSGRWCHKLDADCRLVASLELPRPRPYNSLVPLADGTLVMKDLARDSSVPSALSVVDPVAMELTGPEVGIPEASIARLSAAGSVVYVVGECTVFRYTWDGTGLARDAAWSVPYRDGRDGSRSYGWDPVVDGSHVWWLDQGAHTYAGTMRGAALARGTQRIWRASLGDASDHGFLEPFGLPDAAVTNPPLVDPVSGIVVAYDSANGCVAGVLADEVVWSRDMGQAAHMVDWPDEGVFACEDWTSPSSTAVVFSEIRTGRELGRVALPSAMQSVVFWAPGFETDLYYVSFSGIGRIR